MASTYTNRRAGDAAARQECQSRALTGPANSTRSPRRQHLVRHLHAAGPRPVLEALIEVGAGGCDLDMVLERYARISVETYHALGADLLPIDEMAVISGGRA